jgi:hypothetical protein
MGTALGGFGSSVRVCVSKRIRADEDRRPFGRAFRFCGCACRIGCPSRCSGYIGGTGNRGINVHGCTVT